MAQGPRAPGPQSEVDVLIIGAGPAGLMMANWMSRCGIRTRIVDKRGTKIFNGQADGLQCRTLEIFDSFDFAHRAWIESNHMLEICLWNPDPKTGIIHRSDRIPDTIPNISRFQQVVLHQGRIERFFLDSISEHSKRTLKDVPGWEEGIKVEHGVMPASFEFDESLAEDNDAYPITVKLRHLSEHEATPKQAATSLNGSGLQDGLFRSNLSPDDTKELLEKSKALREKEGREETVKAKYMLGADGAHSWVRDQLGFKLQGESTDYIWGVLDIIPITDFPDIRMRCAIHSESSGSVMVIPRENKLVRLYIQLTTMENAGGGKRADRSKINPDTILASAQRIMKPYKIDYRYCDWWTAYQIGQRVGDSFSLKERVFLAGDAVHTHSPKAGQGMNVSMQDAFNLGWKVASVVKGTSNRSILKTYQSERRRIAQDLIDFDHRFSRLFSGRPAKDVLDEEGISMEEFKNAFEKGNLFASGVAVDYGASVIVAKSGDSTAQGDGTEVLGEEKLRVISTQDRASEADARPWHFQELLKSNGAWRLVVFAGDIVGNPSQKARLDRLGEKLGGATSFLKRFTPPQRRYDAVIEVLSVHASKRQDVTIFDFPEAFRPWDARDGWDYWKIHVDDVSYHEGYGDAYTHYGVDRARGCAVILRPDQYVSWVGDMDDYESMDKFFSGFMVEQPQLHPLKTETVGSEGVSRVSLKDADDAGIQATNGAVVGVAAA
ncbi:Phenol hydroxylase, dimerization domain-containing protein [Cladophialophora immunda]|nr:Phenol hydroxylase, dimerization domain-containing protein [Cladophialophora immunda]